MLTVKLLKQGYRYQKLCTAFSKFYQCHYDLVSKFNVGLKSLLKQGLSEPEFYGDLVYKFRKSVGRHDFSYQFRKIIIRYKRTRYNMNVMWQTACLVVNLMMVITTLLPSLICTPVGSGLRLNKGSSLETFNQLGWGSVFDRAHRGLIVGAFQCWSCCWVLILFHLSVLDLYVCCFAAWMS